MRLAQTQEVRQAQTQRIDPRQIQASEIMAWTTAELEAAIERELAENPSLELRESDDSSPSSFTVSGSSFSPTLSHSAMNTARTEEPLRLLTTADASEPFITPASLSLTPRSTVAGGAGGEWESEVDPLERIAAAPSLRDHLRFQIGQAAATVPHLSALVRYLVECIDERGYLSADEEEVAERFQTTRVIVSQAIQALQTMDPAGVGARDLRECLMLQVAQQEQAGEAHPLARRILQTCWEDLAARREERIAFRLHASRGEVRDALRYLQTSLTPYPSAGFRVERGSGPSNGVPVRPDIVFHRTEAGFSVEMTRDFETQLTIAPLWKRLAEQSDQNNDEQMRRYVRDHVERAQNFLSGVSRRGQTLRRIALALAECQQGFLETGNRAFLRPLTRQALSERLELDESIVSRAVSDKWAQLPGGETLPLDAFFGNAHAVRDALVHLVSSENPDRPYSDDEIADVLTAQGFPLARRTVAKYRGLEKILPARLRRRSAAMAA